MAHVIDIGDIRKRAAHLVRARELRDSLTSLYASDETQDFEFKERVVILWRMFQAELNAADELHKNGL